LAPESVLACHFLKGGVSGASATMGIGDDEWFLALFADCLDRSSPTALC
jgi:hypothetical protein